MKKDIGIKIFVTPSDQKGIQIDNLSNTFLYPYFAENGRCYLAAPCNTKLFKQNFLHGFVTIAQLNAKHGMTFPAQYRVYEFSREDFDKIMERYSEMDAELFEAECVKDEYNEIILEQNAEINALKDKIKFLEKTDNDLEGE